MAATTGLIDQTGISIRISFRSIFAVLLTPSYSSLTNILMHVIIQLIKGVAAFCTAAGPKNGFRPPCSKGGPCYFLSITHREITPTITKQNWNNSPYVTIGITSPRGKVTDRQTANSSLYYFSIFCEVPCCLVCLFYGASSAGRTPWISDTTKS